MTQVLKGPAAAAAVVATNDAANSKGSSANRANTKPRAASWGVTRITPACIAAATMLVRVVVVQLLSFHDVYYRCISR